MPVLVYSCLGLVVFLVILMFVWRFASRRYTLPCPTWLGWLVELNNPFGQSDTATIIRHLDLQPGMNVLDLGRGPGRLTLPIAKQLGPQGEVTAVDIQAGMLQRVQNKAQAAHLTNIRYVQAGAGEGKLGQAQYDRALLVTVLGEIPDREAALKEIFEALKPGGILSLSEIIVDPHYQSRETILRFATAVGFHEKTFYGHRFAFTLQLEKPESS